MKNKGAAFFTGGIGVGLAIGVALGVALDNVALGLDAYLGGDSLLRDAGHDG